MTNCAKATGLLGPIVAVVCAGLASTAMAAPKTPVVGSAPGLITRVQGSADALCREESQVLDTLKKEGARRAIEAFAHVARCDSVRADIASTLATMSGAAGAEPKRDQRIIGKSDERRGPGKRQDDDHRDKAGHGRQDSEAKPDIQLPKASETTEDERRKAAEAAAAEAERRRKAEEAAEAAHRRAAEEAAEKRRRTEEAARRRAAEEAAEERREARRERERAREAARKKTEHKKEVRRREHADKAPSRSGRVTHARCTAMVRAKYTHFFNDREFQIRMGQCMATGGSQY